jgi:hypothetical protein
MKQIVYFLLNSVLHSFDENSMHEHLRIIFELCFVCMNDNKYICEDFWRLCNLVDRDNITVLMYYSIEAFPICFRLTLTFFSLIAKTNVDLCRQVIEYISNMDQFCEYLEDISPEEYVSNGDCIKLVKRRALFDNYMLNVDQKGTFCNSNEIFKVILQSSAVSWNISFNCFDLIEYYFARINFAAAQSLFLFCYCFSDENFLPNSTN